MEHDTIAFIEKNHQVIIATLIAFIAWFRKELCLVAPALWRFLREYKGIYGIWSYIFTGSTEQPIKKKVK